MTPHLDSRDWVGPAGACPEALDELRKSAPRRIPGEYFALLSSRDGGEGPLPVQPYNCCLDDVATLLANLEDAWHQGWLNQRLFVVGGNGGGELIALDLRTPGEVPVVSVDMVAGLDSVRTIADSWARFAEMLGCEA
jgi:hypothetical protein